MIAIAFSSSLGGCAMLETNKKFTANQENCASSFNSQIRNTNVYKNSDARHKGMLINTHNSQDFGARQRCAS